MFVSNQKAGFFVSVIAGMIAFAFFSAPAGAQDGCPALQWSCSNCLYDWCDGPNVQDYNIALRRARCYGDCDADCGDQGRCEIAEVTLEGVCDGYYKVIYDSFCCEYCAY